MQLNLDEIRTIAKLVQKKGLEEVVVESMDVDAPACKLHLRRLQAPVAMQPVSADEANSTAGSAPAAVAEVPAVVITSPAVGVFRYPEGSLTPGQTIRDLQVVGTLESLKVPSEVRASCNGIIDSIQVQDGQGVEFGQVLIELRRDS